MFFKFKYKFSELMLTNVMLINYFQISSKNGWVKWEGQC